MVVHRSFCDFVSGICEIVGETGQIKVYPLNTVCGKWIKGDYCKMTSISFSYSIDL